eukprot:TRINITY_DN7961_c0_g2_i1.p1 TRINITY_DN7961_c0_g2~~TRINITY_DN7961_c0_g2_i1.p1  ORF type:complete len:735 (+),score=140.48 TRINITY_DN7961_c0_g2_i1:65-2206(+)
MGPRRVRARLIACRAALLACAVQSAAVDVAKELQALKSLARRREEGQGGGGGVAPETPQPPPPQQRPQSVTNADLGWQTPQKIPAARDGPKSVLGPRSLIKAGQGAGAQMREALGTLEGMQPGTPPTMQELDDLVAAARADQKYMCETWPDNADCALLAGQPERPAFHTRDNSPIEDMLAWKIVLRDEALIISVMGSSSTAGHSAYFNSTYAATLLRRLRPIFASIGVEQDTRNQAMGGWDYRMGTMWCIPQIAGFDPDIVTWEWNMFGPDPCTMEAYRRAVHSLPRRPSVVWSSVSGPEAGGKFWGDLYGWGCRGAGEAKEVCQKILQGAARLPDPKAAGRGDEPLPCGAAEEWENVIRDAKCFEEYQVKNGRLRQSDPVFAKAIQLYRAARPKEQPPPHQWPEVKLSSWNEQLDAYYIPRGLGSYHQRTSGAVNRDWQPWWLYRHPVLRQSHHPGTFGHILIGHQFVHWVLERLVGAVGRVRKALQEAGSMEKLVELYRSQRARHRGKPLPAPQLCGKRGAEDGHGARHLCLTNFRPRRDLNASIDSIVVDAGGWAIGRWDETQKDDGKSYRDHKLITDSGIRDDPGTLKLKFTAPPGEWDVDVGICLYGKYVAHEVGTASCNDKKVRVALGSHLRGKQDSSAPPFPVYATGLPFKGNENPRPGENGVPNPADPNMNPCRLVCTVKPGTPVDLHLRAEPGERLVVTHVIAV